MKEDSIQVGAGIDPIQHVIDSAATRRLLKASTPLMKVVNKAMFPVSGSTVPRYREHGAGCSGQASRPTFLVTYSMTGPVLTSDYSGLSMAARRWSLSDHR